MRINTAVVLAAGEGQRLRPLTENRPKPMLPAANRPILEYVFDALIDAGIDDLHVVVGYERDRVQDHFGPTYRDRTITYHVQSKQLGSGHALLATETALEGDFLVVNGDEVIDEGIIQTVVSSHSTEDSCTLAVTESTDAPLYGAVSLDGETVTELIEKPGTGGYRLLNAGVYALNASVFTTLQNIEREAGELALTGGIAAMIQGGDHVRGVTVDGMRSKVTYPWDLPELATQLLAEGRVNERQRGKGYVAESAMIADDAVLYGPVVIGPDSVVEPGAVIGPDTALGKNVTVEAGATVRRSVVDADTRIGTNAILVDSVTGEGVDVGPGATVPGGLGDVRVGNQIHEDEQLGCVLADRVHLGGGSTVASGLLVGPGARIAAGVTLRKNIAEETEVQG